MTRETAAGRRTLKPADMTDRVTREGDRSEREDGSGPTRLREQERRISAPRVASAANGVDTAQTIFDWRRAAR